MFAARLKEIKSRIQKFALSKGLLPRHKDYTQFIILSRSRSGSNYLVDLLNCHQGITCFNELFSRSGVTYWGLPGYGSRSYKSSRFRHVKESDPVNFLLTYIYNQHPVSVSAVGFKLFYNQAKNGDSRSLWDYLSKLYDLKIIHLQRRNLLNIVASKKIAETNNEWIKRGRHSYNKKMRITLSHDECVAQFVKTRSWEIESAELFKSQRIMDIYYEDLVSDLENVMGNVQDFLGVERQHLSATTRKQSTMPISDVIDNFQELKVSFKATEWESLFNMTH